MISGTISTVTIIGNNTANNTGGGYPSSNDTSEEFIWINFFWDDNNDGYQITDDGTLTISLITIEARY